MSRSRRRLAAVLLGCGILVLLELSLRLAGLAGPGSRPDSSTGFAPAEPLFERLTDDAGNSAWHTRADRVGAFNPQSFSDSKPAGNLRFFCLGGSSTFGFPRAAAASFCADVERGLQAARPELEVEVINCGGMSYGSRRVLNVMRETARHQPDAYLVYMGHNEYVERRFFAPFLGESEWRRSLRWTLNQVRLVVLVRQLLAPLRQARTNEDFYGVGPVRDDSRRLPRTDAEDRLVAEQFRFVVDEMAAVAHASGAPLLLINPAPNLRDWAPEASTWRADLAPEASEQRDANYARALAHMQQTDLPAALEAVRQVLAVDAGAAAAHYLMGQIEAAQGETAAALQSLQRAVDLDAVPIRITSPLRQAITDTWERHGLLPLDALARMTAVTPGGITGDEMLLDYCHPSRAGHLQIAQMVMEQLYPMFWPGEPLPPATLSSGLPGGEDATAPSSAFGAAWLGQMFLRQGEPEKAMEMFRAAVARDPRLATAQEGLGRTLAMSGHLAEAIVALEEATRLAPGMDTGWNNLGLVYLAAGRAAAAAQAFPEALQVSGGRPLVRTNLARALAAQERWAEAREEASQALSESPALALAWMVRAEAEVALGEAERGINDYRRALQLDPGLQAAREALRRLEALP